jgi:hypothetical protein
MRDTSDKIKMDVSRKNEMREKLLSSPAKTTELPKNKTKKRALTVILVAAVVSAMGITAYAAITGGIGALSFGRSSWGPSIEEDIKYSMPPREEISSQGYPDSPEYKAAAEWLKFEQNYDRDYKIINEFDEEVKRTGVDPFNEKYGAYLIYSQEMADKVDEITAKYNLKLHQNWDDGDEKKLEDKVGDIFNDNITGAAYFYDDGTFQMDALYKNDLNFQIRRCMRGYFDTVAINVGSTKDFEEYTYMTKSGIPVIISTGTDARGNRRAFITANLEKSFVTINIQPRDYDGNINDYTNKDIEAIADSFYFDKM